MLKIIIQAAIFILVPAGILFCAAGRLDWGMAWAYLSIHLSSIIIILFVSDPEMLSVRTHKEEKPQRWDFFLVGLSFLFYCPLSFLIAGLDYGRFHWSPSLPISIQLSALLVFALGQGFASWTMIINRFFVKFVRIQKERGHYVVTNGPYAYVRHPGYAGTVLAFAALPVAFNSLWALIPASVGGGLLVFRTFLEDRFLQKELDGYREYVLRVRWYLYPGIW
jgi:protein-S-isoprenylcysteine O-methyltransferase Ste14